MHTQQLKRLEIADVMNGGVEKLMAGGVSRRVAVRRIARKHGVNRRSVKAMIACADLTEGGPV